MKDDYIQQTITNYIDAYNNFDIPGMLVNLHPAFVFKNVERGEVNLVTNGLIEFKAQAEAAATFFSQRKQTITDIQIEGRMAEVAIVYNAVLAVDLPNGLQKGESLSLQGKSIFNFQDGLITSIEDHS